MTAAIGTGQNSPPTTPPIGGVEFIDETGGRAELVFHQQIKGNLLRSFVEVRIDDMKLAYLVLDNVCEEEPDLLFLDSKSIRVQDIGNRIIGITTLDSKDKERKYYVDTSRAVAGIANVVYNYIPTPLTRREASDKVARLQADHPDVRVIATVFNRHGVFVMGKDGRNRPALLRAKPNESKLARIKKIRLRRFKNICFLEKLNRNFSFCFDWSNKKVFINNERAQILR